MIQKYYASCATFLFLPHFDVICDLLLKRRTATWNLFVKYKEPLGQSDCRKLSHIEIYHQILQGEGHYTMIVRISILPDDKWYQLSECLVNLSKVWHSLFLCQTLQPRLLIYKVLLYLDFLRCKDFFTNSQHWDTLCLPFEYFPLPLASSHAQDLEHSFPRYRNNISISKNKIIIRDVFLKCFMFYHRSFSSNTITYLPDGVLINQKKLNEL